MRPRRLVPVALAIAGLVAIVIGIHQGLVHVAPGYDGTITTGWGGDLNHEERLLARLALVGVVGAVAARRWRRLAVVPAATGGVVLFYALRAALHYALDPGLYVEVSAYGGPTRLVLGAEPFLLVAGGALLVGAAVVEWRARPDDADGGASAPTPSVR
ncbi:hypothetical protein [Haloplanus aerogenes]|uniref:DUF3995 domain-containing protein n=1 Tax=Haloplanus aerogenes TaxID=660522 RepID=A0A3M0DXI4_9EURY|nr:hypothetical protein [Haloplanus aerogenes]AZH24153.1 hypothetical protein DU502_01630 [Haloplanus aerogenes]RMB24229.1 hypothetical protein ATH50_1471 [Haloplanus aerogenes]